MKRMSDKQKKAQLRKARRLAAADFARKTGKDPKTREVHIKAIAGKDAVFFQTRTGLFSPRSGPVYTLTDLDVADCLDNPAKMVEVGAKLGFIVLAQVMRYRQPAAGQKALTELADITARWMGMDVEALRKELAAERADEGPTATATDAVTPTSSGESEPETAPIAGHPPVDLHPGTTEVIGPRL